MERREVIDLDRHPVRGAGLGFRRGLLGELEKHDGSGIDFFELAPENWIGVGGALARRLRAFTERFPFVAHGLSLSLGGPAPLDERLLADVRVFLDLHGIRAYTEHLSYCSDEGQLYDLMPIPFTGDAVRHVAGRIRRAQEILERPIAVENVSYYAAPGASYRRYDLAAAVFASLDVAGSVSLYHELKPLIDEAYAEISPPGRRFDDRLLTAIDHLLAVPVLDDDVRLEEKVVTYSFADPRLEALSGAQRQLLRMGPDNVRVVQERLSEFRRTVAS